MSPRCPNNHPNRAGARYCQTCGARLDQPPTAAYRAPAPVAVSVQATGARQVRNLRRAASAGRASAGLGAGISSAMGIAGGLASAAAFFWGWLTFSMPAMNFLLGSSKPVTISGYEILTMGPGTYRSIPIVLVVLIPALGAAALVLSAFAALSEIFRRRPWGLVHIALGLGGLVALAALLTFARGEPEQLMNELGLKGAMSSLLSAAMIRIEPAPGYALNAVGYVLILVGGLVGFAFGTQRQID